MLGVGDDFVVGKSGEDAERFGLVEGLLVVGMGMVVARGRGGRGGRAIVVVVVVVVNWVRGEISGGEYIILVQLGFFFAAGILCWRAEERAEKPVGCWGFPVAKPSRSAYVHIGAGRVGSAVRLPQRDDFREGRGVFCIYPME